ncbi:MAG: lmo0937 family membrane protein [Cyanobacteria bacterium SZAS-4]|nr:lmo0937 family membrane protein [Cyanobacteria bacterium SZAS-4]
MLYSVIALMLAFWFVGLFMHIGGSWIHTLLALALVVFVYDLLGGRQRA